MSQINKKYLDILNEIDKEHSEFSNLHRNSKILIIDGLNTFIRSWSTAPNLTDNGDHVGGIVGTLKSIGFAVRTLNPTRVILVFDGKGGSTSRQKIHSEYKAGRAKNKIRLNRTYADMMTAEDEQVSMKRQMVALADLLTCLPVSTMVYDGIEADDVMAYIATQLKKENESVSIMSTDKDFLQLVNKNVTLYSPTKKKIYNIDEVIDEYGIHPHNFINYRMMDGDKSDNIDGIKGFGLKTIIKNFPILKEETVQTLDSITDYVNSLPKKTNQHNLFLDNLEICKRNCRLMQLSEPEFSGIIRMKILERYNEEITHFDKQKFLKYALKYRIMDTFPGITEWLQSTWSHAAKFK